VTSDSPIDLSKNQNIALQAHEMSFNLPQEIVLAWERLDLRKRKKV